MELRSVPVQQDMLIEVLIYLPIKSLVRFTCVSMYWCALIKSHTFRTRHLNRDCKETLLVKRFLPNSNSEVYLLGDIILSFHDPDCPELLVSPNYVPPFCKDTWNTEIDLYGSCNGLVCLISQDVVILSNPALRESKMLAPSPFALPDGYMAINYGSGFGYDAKTNDYKIIQMWHITELVGWEHFFDADSCIRIDLYNSSTNSWKIIDALIPRVYNNSGFDLYFNGAFPWASCELIEGPSTMATILTFDVRNEVFREFKCPYHEGKESALMVLNTCLALLHYYGSDVRHLNNERIWC